MSSKLVKICGVLVLATTLFLWAAQRYRVRPFFASNFHVFGPGGRVMSWDLTRGIAIDQSRYADYDPKERVILVVSLDSDRNVQWVADRQRLASVLCLRRQSDGLGRNIAWRPDSIIFIGQDGSPSYAVLAPGRLEQVMGNPQTFASSLSALIAEADSSRNVP